MITPAMHMEAVRAMRPDVAALLTSETPAGMSAKAAVEGCKRSLRWLDECLQVMKLL